MSKFVRIADIFRGFEPKKRFIEISCTRTNDGIVYLNYDGTSFNVEQIYQIVIYVDKAHPQYNGIAIRSRKASVVKYFTSREECEAECVRLKDFLAAHSLKLKINYKAR